MIDVESDTGKTTSFASTRMVPSGRAPMDLFVLFDLKWLVDVHMVGFLVEH